MKKFLRNWLGIESIEKGLESQRAYTAGGFADIKNNLTLEYDTEYTEKDIKTAVRYIMHHLNLGWQLEIRRTYEPTTAREDKRWTIKPYKEIKTQVKVIEEDITNH